MERWTRFVLHHRRATAELPTGKLVSVLPLSDAVVAAQIVSELEPAEAKGSTGAMRRAAGSIPGARLYLTGQAATEHDLDPVFSEDLKKGELYLAIPIALVIPTVSVIAALTFLPVLLSLVGSRLERIRLLPKELMERRADHEHGFWAKLAHWIMRRPWRVAIGTTAFPLLRAGPRP